MTNIWTTTTKQIEIWGQAAALRLTAGTGVFSFIGVVATLLAPLALTAGTGVFIEAGNNATLTFSGSSTSGSPMGLLLALTYP